jgi:hypothetical protein
MMLFKFKSVWLIVLSAAKSACRSRKYRAAIAA